MLNNLTDILGRKNKYSNIGNVLFIEFKIMKNRNNNKQINNFLENIKRN